jgi:hypothetical protein
MLSLLDNQIPCSPALPSLRSLLPALLLALLPALLPPKPSERGELFVARLGHMPGTHAQLHDVNAVRSECVVYGVW